MKTAATTAPAHAAATPVGGTASTVKHAFGDWLRQLGAIDGGEPVAADTLRLRFTSNTDAMLATSSLSDSIDGVRLSVQLQDGRPPAGPTPDPGETAAFLARIRDVARVERRSIPAPAFVVTSPTPDVNARLDWLLRDEIAGLPVRWQTADA